MLNRRQAITRNNAHPVHWRIYTALALGTSTLAAWAKPRHQQPWYWPNLHAIFCPNTEEFRQKSYQITPKAHTQNFQYIISCGDVHILALISWNAYRHDECIKPSISFTHAGWNQGHICGFHMINIIIYMNVHEINTYHFHKVGTYREVFFLFTN